jgi:hypothetical protein
MALMDTIRLSNVAEDLISHKLQRAGMLVAKPKFDQAGTDLLAFVEIGDGVKFCRIQCKGRSVVKRGSSIEIPEAYVTNGFVFVLYVETGLKERGDLFCFFSNDIRQWRKNKHGKYQLAVPRFSVDEKLAFYRFDDSKIQLIKSVIRSAEMSGEFRGMVFARLNATLEPVHLKARATITNPGGST